MNPRPTTPSVRSFPALRIAWLAGLSALRFVQLVASSSLHLRHDRLGTWYEIDDWGRYMIFQETVGNDGTPDDHVVLVVGFRLPWLGSSPVLHWLFQRVCLLTTPFWSGFRGFRVKLWMVGQSRDYLGIYEWAGESNAQIYLGALLPVLRALSAPGSVWSEMHPHQELEVYLQSRKL